MTDKEFIEEVYEISFGDNAINREFTQQDVLDQLRQFSDDSCEKHDSQSNGKDVEYAEELDAASYT